MLDPFAGSGTTGHAVALANSADGGTRRCISINSAEPTRAGSNAQLAGLATVADITRARLTAVAEQVGGGLVVHPPPDTPHQISASAGSGGRNLMRTTPAG